LVPQDVGDESAVELGEQDKDEDTAEVEASVLWEAEDVGTTNCRFVALRFS
jgi:hypothetical protein